MRVTAAVTTSDDGGSSGQLRRELGVLPGGDLRRVMGQMSSLPSNLRDLFEFRFSTGAMRGHVLGNLILAAAELQAGDRGVAIQSVADLMGVDGNVVAVTVGDAVLVAEQGGMVHVGESTVASARLSPPATRLSLRPGCRMTPELEAALATADLVVVAPGSLLTSTAPVLLVPGVVEALNNPSAHLVMVANLVDEPGHTDGLTVGAHMSFLSDQIGRFRPDVVCHWDGTIPLGGENLGWIGLGRLPNWVESFVGVAPTMIQHDETQPDVRPHRLVRHELRSLREALSTFV